MLKTSQKHINQNIHDQKHTCSKTPSMGQNTPKIEKNGAQGGPISFHSDIQNHPIKHPV